MKKVLVLMSTYNGEKYIKEQLDSILSQEGVYVYCLIRDDGSTDDTQKIIYEYCLKNPNVYYYKGNNIGWAKSFYRLVMESKKYYCNYYAFSDQDDVWDSKKLIRAISQLDKKNPDEVLLYCSNLKIVDENLNWTSEREYFNKVNLSKKSALIENFSVGCTQVFNNKLRDLYLSYKPNYIHAHDFWMYLIATYMGKVIYDDNSYIYYRQHSNNVYGASKGLRELWTRRIRLLSKQYLKNKFNQHRLEKMAQELLKGYSNYLDAKDIKTIKTVALYRQNISRRLVFFFTFGIRKKSFLENIEFRIRIIIGIV